MDWTMLFTFIQGLAPWCQYVLMALGSIVVIGTSIDKVKHIAIFDKIMAVPFLGAFLVACKRFSPFNTKE